MPTPQRISDARKAYLMVLELASRWGAAARAEARLRRFRPAWLVSLTFETTVQPGMPDHLVEMNDYARAGAIFGHIQFG